VKRAPYTPGDMVRGDYPTDWGTLSGVAPVLTCVPAAAPNRWTVTVRLGDEARGEAVTVTYTVNSAGNSVTGSRYLRRVDTPAAVRDNGEGGTVECST
jgi:hypothetical protein